MKTKTGMLICFSIKSERFASTYERNKFFRHLYGWKQIIVKHKHRYTYKRGGLLDEIPHIKVDQSSFIVGSDDFDKIVNFFEEWSDKVIWKNFKVLLDKEIEDLIKKE